MYIYIKHCMVWNIVIAMGHPVSIDILIQLKVLQEISAMIGAEFI